MLHGLDQDEDGSRVDQKIEGMLQKRAVIDKRQVGDFLLVDDRSGLFQRALQFRKIHGSDQFADCGHDHVTLRLRRLTLVKSGGKERVLMGVSVRRTARRLVLQPASGTVD